MAYDSGLLGSGEQGSEALERAKVAIPPAVEEWMKYFGLEVCELKNCQHTQKSLILPHSLFQIKHSG